MRVLASTLCFTTCITVLASQASEPTLVLPVSNLPWTLLGVFTHTIPGQASATVSVEKQAHKFVRVGDLIADNVRLEAVADTYIVLMNQGTAERLYFARARKALPLEIGTVSVPENPSQTHSSSDEQHVDRAETNVEIRAKIGAAVEQYLQAQKQHDESS